MDRMTHGLNYKIISTGSKGNALIIEDSILIDCGVSYKALEDEKFHIVFLTHEHGDHFNKSTLKRLAKERPLLRIACSSTIRSDVMHDCEVKGRQIDIIDPGKWYTYSYGSKLRARSFDLIHDVRNVGWLFEINGFRCMYATDTATLEYVRGSGFKRLDYYFIEANYEEEELEERLKAKLEANEYTYEERVKRTHLSREQADKWLSLYAGEHSKVIYLHKHEED